MNKSKVVFVAAIAMVSCIGCDWYFGATSSPPDASSGGTDNVAAADATTCQHKYDRVCYDLPVPTETGIVPIVGHYTVRPTDPAVSVEPLSKFGFSVVRYQPSIVITMDTFRYDSLFLSKGTFSLIHGASFDGTYFPSDGYSITSSFVTPTQAEGLFQFMPGLNRHPLGSFIATLDVPPEPAVDAGTNLDSSGQ